MVQSRAKRIKNEIQKIKKTLMNPVQKNQRYRDKSENLCSPGWTDSADAYDCIAEYRERALYISWEEIDWEEIDDEAFWSCTARAEKQKGIEMW